MMYFEKIMAKMIIVVSIASAFTFIPTAKAWHPLTGDFSLPAPRIPAPRPFRRNDPQVSCLAVYNPVRTYKYRIINNTDSTINYSLDEQNASLRPGAYTEWTSKVGGGDCNSDGYSYPVLAFDENLNDGRFTSRKVGLDGWRQFEFNYVRGYRGEKIGLWHVGNLGRSDQEE